MHSSASLEWPDLAPDLETTEFASAIGSAGNNNNQPLGIFLSEHETLRISGAPGETVTLALRSFRLTDHAMVTLRGTATTTFVINVERGFSLSNRARIVLAGGVRADHVTFNVIDHGHNVSLGGASKFRGNLAAPERTVWLRNHALVQGTVVARRLFVRGHARIQPPPVVSQ